MSRRHPYTIASRRKKRRRLVKLPGSSKRGKKVRNDRVKLRWAVSGKLCLQMLPQVRKIRYASVPEENFLINRACISASSKRSITARYTKKLSSYILVCRVSSEDIHARISARMSRWRFRRTRSSAQTTLKFLIFPVNRQHPPLGRSLN